jgi:adenylate kinase
MFIVLFGIQGSGKGTQGQLLARKLGIPHLSTGEILRAMAAEGTTEGEAVKAKIESGQYLSDEDMTNILRNHLPRDCILDGYPRTLAQAKTLDTIARVDVCVYIDLHEKEAMRRALARGRADDTPDAIHQRFLQYRAEADAILNHYESQGKLLDINGDQTIEAVFAELCEKLENKSTLAS